MSVVIIGGNECMERKYKNLCKEYGYKPKIFLKPSGNMKDRIGVPDLLIFFTHTVSHKMVKCALNCVDEQTKVVRTHTSSIASLKEILKTQNGL